MTAEKSEGVSGLYVMIQFLVPIQNRLLDYIFYPVRKNQLVISKKDQALFQLRIIIRYIAQGIVLQVRQQGYI